MFQKHGQTHVTMQSIKNKQTTSLEINECTRQTKRLQKSQVLSFLLLLQRSTVAQIL